MNKHSLSISSNQIDSFRQGYHLVADFPRNCRTDDGWLPYLQIMLPVSFISDVEREKYQILGSALGSAFVNLVWLPWLHFSQERRQYPIKKNSNTRVVRALCLKLWIRFGGSHLCNKTINVRPSLALIEDLVAIPGQAALKRYLFAG